jgi:hypothetical protein
MASSKTETEPPDVEKGQARSERVVPPPARDRGGPGVAGWITALASTVTAGAGIIACGLLMYAIAEVQQAREEVRRVGERVSSLESQVSSLDGTVSGIARSDVLKLDAVMMRGSETWTLPVSSITWSGR